MAKQNITIQQGADYGLQIQYLDPTGNAVNLTSYTARMDIRTTYTAPTAVIRLTTENGRIMIGAANGYINLALTGAETANIPASNCVYDLELVNGSSVIRLLEGKVTITPEVTK